MQLNQVDIVGSSIAIDIMIRIRLSSSFCRQHLAQAFHDLIFLPDKQT